MSKKKTKVAATRSIPYRYKNPETGKMAEDELPLTPQRLEWSKELITKFAKEYWRNPECPALVMRRIIMDIEAELDISTHQENMNDVQIILDAADLFYAGIHLKYDFQKNHDKSCEILTSILRRHAPKVLESIYKINEKSKKQQEQ